jgi:hypothetical protein
MIRKIIIGEGIGTGSDRRHEAPPKESNLGVDRYEEFAIEWSETFIVKK